MRRLLLLALLAPLGWAQDSLATRAQQKLDLISDRKAKPGSVVTLTPQEVNAWIHQKAVKSFPQGLRNERIDIGAGTADGYALVDFLKMQKNGGRDVNRLIAALIEGERPLKISIRVDSANGRCTVYLTRVELSGVALEGSVLDFMIRNFVKPRYPDITINEPFDLDFNIDRIDAQPSGVRITIKKQ